MTEYQIRNRFIPFRKADIIEMCINDSRLSKQEQNSFRQFCHILQSLIHFIALALGLATLGGFLFKQINKFKNRKIKFMKALSDNLYFKNLDNNTGVFHHLLDTAEEEEFKEAILAYYFLLAEDRDLTTTELDETVERWFENKHNCRINFEIQDALQKLERWNLVNRDGNIIRVKNMTDAMQQLDKIWDNYFLYHKADEPAG